MTEFVGFLTGYRHGGEAKVAFSLLGAAIALWATFAPCFLWIFVGAPCIEHLGTLPGLAGALSGVTAAVVGVILNLSLWFALHAFFARSRPCGEAHCSFGYPISESTSAWMRLMKSAIRSTMVSISPISTAVPVVRLGSGLRQRAIKIEKARGSA